MRYVADAPLRSLRADLGLTRQGTKMMPFATVSSQDHSASSTRLRTVEQALGRLEELVDGHAIEIAALALEADSEPAPKYVQNSVTLSAHRLRPSDDTRTICGICIVGATFRARLQDNSRQYLPIDSLAEVPGPLMCERCLKSERNVVMTRELIDADISGDEEAE